MKLIIFRADSSDKIGSGHIFRCINLAKKLKRKNNRILFICQNLKGNFINYIKKNKFKVIINKNVSKEKKIYNWSKKNQIKDANFLTNKEKKIDLIVSDHYGLGSTWRKKIRPFCKKIFLIDDFDRNKEFCDFYLNHNQYHFKNNLKKPKINLCGIDYLLTGNNLKFIKKKTNLKKNIFFYMGSVDSKNITLKFVKLINDIKFKDYKFFIMIGRNNRLKNYYFSNKIKISNVKFIEDTINNFQSFYKKIDITFSGANTTMYEQLKFGFKPFVIPQNNLQARISKNLHDQKYINLLQIRNIKKNSLKKMIDRNINFFFKPNSKISKKLRINSVIKIAHIIEKNTI